MPDKIARKEPEEIADSFNARLIKLHLNQSLIT